MPRGIPKNNIEKNMKKVLDTNETPLNAALTAGSEIGNIEEKKVSPQVAKKADNEEFTTSPDGKYLIPKPKSHGTFIEDNSTRIPYFDLPGRVVAWHVDRESNELPLQVRRGWEFVTTDTDDVPHGQQLVVWGGSRADGSTYHHYAMYMPVERFHALKQAEQDRLKDHELEQGIYATEQMTLGTKYQHGIVKKD